MIYVLFVIGFVLLIKGADLLVEGASTLAQRYGVPSIIVGLTIVAFGTSLPELIINVISAVRGNTDIAMGNVIGSNISNILLIMGLTAAICPLKVKASTAWKEIPFSMLALAVLFVVSNDVLIDNLRESLITRSDGVLMFCVFAIFIYYLFEMALKHHAEIPLDGTGRQVKKIAKEEKRQKKIWVIVLMLLGGLVGLYLGGRWVVEGAVVIARKFGLSDFLISASIIAVGTSLPELVTSLTAAIKEEPDLSVGNIVGSNIFNVFLVLGTTSIIKPIPVTPGINNDIIFTMVITLYLFLFLFLGKDYKIERWQGVVFFILYVFYIAYIILRG